MACDGSHIGDTDELSECRRIEEIAEVDSISFASRVRLFCEKYFSIALVFGALCLVVSMT